MGAAWSSLLEKAFLAPINPTLYPLANTVSSDGIVYTAFLFVPIPLGFFFKKRGLKVKKYGAAAAGLALTLAACGIHTIHSLVTILGTWIIIKISPRYSHQLTLGWTFSYLLFFHKFTSFKFPQTTHLTKSVQLLLTLKMVSVANEVQELIQAKKQEVTSDPKSPVIGVIPKIPGLTEMLCYSYCYVGLMTGSGGGLQVSPSLFLQLPSNQTLRFRGKKAAAWEAAWEGASVPMADPHGLVPEVLLEEEREEIRLLKEMPLCLEEKRKLRMLQKQAVKQLSGWQLWRAEKLKTLHRVQSQAGIAISSAEMWRGTLHHIEGHFGTGIQSYFNFLRFLVLMNFAASLLVVGFVIAPNAAFEALRLNWTSQPNSSLVNTQCQQYNPTPQGLVSYFSYIMDLLSGKGFIEQTYLFYGYYPNLAVSFVNFSYDIPLAYLLTTLFYLLFCLAWIVRRSVLCLKQSLVSEDTSLASYSNKVFAGWDFSLMQKNMVQLKHKSIRYELRMDLEEAAFRKRQAEWTTSQRVGLYLLRSLLNVLVLVLLGGSFCCIYLATSFSQGLLGKTDSSDKGQYFLELLVAYLPSIVITAANLLIPMIFEVLVPLEKYPLSFQIKITLLRNVFLRFASLAVVLITLWGQITCNGDLQKSECQNCGYNHHLHPCWETSVGQEMYKLMIFDLVITLLVTLFVEFPRKMLVTYLPSCPLIKWWGEQEFMVPGNILDLVYGQTLCWTGALFCPLLPVLNTVKYIAVFYLKKLTLYANCHPAERTFRASSSNFFFLLILLPGLTISCVPALYSIFVLPPSKACGPFRDEPTMWNVVSKAVSELPTATQDFLRFLGSVAFAVPLFLLLSILMFYLKALANSYSSMVKGLKGQLRLEGQDKLFLVKRISELSQ